MPRERAAPLPAMLAIVRLPAPRLDADADRHGDPAADHEGPVMATARQYRIGRCSQADVAAELGVTVRQARRIEDEAVAWWTLAVCKAKRQQLGMEPMKIPPRRFPCPISATLPQDGAHAPRIVSPLLEPSPAREPAGRRAGLPRRFKGTHERNRR